MLPMRLWFMQNCQEDHENSIRLHQLATTHQTCQFHLKEVQQNIYSLGQGITAYGSIKKLRPWAKNLFLIGSAKNSMETAMNNEVM